jgi:hypothetical protein
MSTKIQSVSWRGLFNSWFFEEQQISKIEWRISAGEYIINETDWLNKQRGWMIDCSGSLLVIPMIAAFVESVPMVARHPYHISLLQLNLRGTIYQWFGTVQYMVLPHLYLL